MSAAFSSPKFKIPKAQAALGHWGTLTGIASMINVHPDLTGRKLCIFEFELREPLPGEPRIPIEA